MQFYVMARTYNTYGGHSTLSLISGFLLGDAGDFGSAVSELTVTFHFPHTGQALSSLEQLYADFHANRQSLPKVVFRRKRGQASIDIASELLDGKDWEQRRGLSLPLFKAGVAETIAALELLKNRLTAKDDFHLAAFLAHCNEARSRLPSTVEDLAALADECKKRQGRATRPCRHGNGWGLTGGTFIPTLGSIWMTRFSGSAPTTSPRMAMTPALISWRSIASGFAGIPRVIRSSFTKG